MFWANGHFRRPAILSAGINGSDVRELISDNLGEPGMKLTDTHMVN